MHYRALGGTGVQVSVLGLGTNQFGGVVDEAGVRAIIDRAFELGVNFLDTAEVYAGGTSEECGVVALSSLVDATGSRI
jgi:aryl-alcohol dehydrogenase-like predicted oxidoreductase